MSDTSELGGIDDGHTATRQQVEEELRTSDEIRSSYVSGLTFTNRPVRYSVVEEQAIFEGDILLGTVEEMEQIRQSVEGPPPEGAARGIVIPGSGFRWPNRTVNFTVDNALPNTQRVTDAIQHWEDNTNVRFRQRTNEANFATFRPSTGCSSSVGMRGGQQFINLAGGCTTGSTIHEIGHCAGLWHEQSREDRNLFVTIDFTNIQPATLHNFDQHITDGDDIAPYDYDSIMHYSSTAFAIDSSKPTIIAPQPIGQRNGLSEFDIRSINAIYPLKTVLGDQSTNGPALTQRASELLLGWTGVGNLRLNCMRSGDGSAFSGKVTLNETTESSPALAVFGDLLCIAWRGVGNNQLNVMLSTNGRNWLAKRTMTDTTTSGPALAVVNSRLLLAWRGVANNLLNAMRSFNGSTFFGKVTLPETTLSKPFLHVDDEIAYLCWQGVGNGFLNLLPSLDGLDWRGKITSGETCIDGPVLGTVGDHLVWGWTGTDQAHSLNTGLI